MTSPEERITLNYFAPSNYWDVVVDGQIVFQGSKHDAEMFRAELLLRMRNA